MTISLATFLANLVKISVAFTLAPQNFKLLTCEVTNPQIIVNPNKNFKKYVIIYFYSSNQVHFSKKDNHREPHVPYHSGIFI